MPKVDAIGVSSAGVYVNNKIMVASLFLKVSDEDFDKKVKYFRKAGQKTTRQINSSKSSALHLCKKANFQNHLLF